MKYCLFISIIVLTVQQNMRFKHQNTNIFVQAKVPNNLLTEEQKKVLKKQQDYEDQERLKKISQQQIEQKQKEQKEKQRLLKIKKEEDYKKDQEQKSIEVRILIPPALLNGQTKPIAKKRRRRFRYMK